MIRDAERVTAAVEAELRKRFAFSAPASDEEWRRDARHVAKAALAVAPPPLLVTREQAAEMLAMSLRHWQRHVQGQIPLVRSGALRLVPVAELESWIAAHRDR